MEVGAYSHSTVSLSRDKSQNNLAFFKGWDVRVLKLNLDFAEMWNFYFNTLKNLPFWYYSSSLVIATSPSTCRTGASHLQQKSTKGNFHLCNCFAVCCQLCFIFSRIHLLYISLYNASILCRPSADICTERSSIYCLLASSKGSHTWDMWILELILNFGSVSFAWL